MDILSYIKRLLLRDRVIFTIKAQEEMLFDGLTDDEVIEAIVNASAIYKTLRSGARGRRGRASGSRKSRARDRLYVIVGETYDGVAIYTKGTIRRQRHADVFYVLISAKHAVR